MLMVSMTLRLDTSIHLNDDGTTKVTVYRKPTHTDQYLHFNSNHHLANKRSIVRTLFHRAEKIVTNEEARKSEIEHCKNALRDLENGYSEWMFKIPKKGENTTG